jgi:hypothetical protein
MGGSGKRGNGPTGVQPSLAAAASALAMFAFLQSGSSLWDSSHAAYLVPGSGVWRETV